jgi:Mn-dependent DtxR family transcriptional regulator
MLLNEELLLRAIRGDKSLQGRTRLSALADAIGTDVRTVHYMLVKLQINGRIKYKFKQGDVRVTLLDQH